MVKIQQQQQQRQTTTTTTNKTNNHSKKPSIWRIYKTAARPHTLTASLCPCLVAYAATTGTLNTTKNPRVVAVWPYCWCLWVLFCMTVQLGTNFHNDYADFVKGADDTQTRVGQKRATAQGWLTPAQTCRASCICLSMAATAGVLLLQLTAQWHNGLAWFVVVSSIWNAFADTARTFSTGIYWYGKLEYCVRRPGGSVCAALF